MTTTEQTAVAKTEPKPDTVMAVLEKMKPQLAAALPRHLTADRLVRVALTAIQNTPALLTCDRKSLYAAIMACAQLGLEPDGILGQAYLVPFKGKVQFIPGYRGLIKLARQTGEVISISAHEVCEEDKFEFAFGLNEKCDHVPAAGERGKITYFYAVAHFKDGGHAFEVMTLADVEKVRNGSEGWKAFKAGKIKVTPWDSHFVEMGRKTLIRRLAKYLPMDVQKAAMIDEMAEAGRHATLTDLGDLMIEGSAEDVTDQSPDQRDSGSKLDQFAATAPHDPATGEVIEKREPVPPAAIPVGKLPNDPNVADWEGWALAFRQHVDGTASIGDLDQLRKLNKPQLANLAKANSPKHAWCMDIYDTRRQELEKEAPAQTAA